MDKKQRALIPAGFFRLLRAKCLGAKFPHAVQFNITFRCNQRCVYCGIYNDEREEMSTDEIRRMIDEFAVLGTAKISLTGGEPLIRDDIAGVIRHAKSRGMVVSLSTNGSLIADRIDQLGGVDTVDMTLDGPEKVHDGQRGSGNFAEVINAVELLQKKGIPLYAVTVLTKNNCALIGEMLHLARKINIKLLIQPVFYAEQSHANYLEGYERTKCDDGSMIEALDEIIALRGKDEESLVLSKRYYRNIKEAMRMGKKIRCRNAGRFFCTISPDGKVAPCNLLVRDHRWLNGNEVGFKKAFFDMPDIACEGCLSSFLDINDLYSLRPDVVKDYYRHYLNFFRSLKR